MIYRLCSDGWYEYPVHGRRAYRFWMSDEDGVKKIGHKTTCE